MSKLYADYKCGCGVEIRINTDGKLPSSVECYHCHKKVRKYGTEAADAEATGDTGISG